MSNWRRNRPCALCGEQIEGTKRTGSKFCGKCAKAREKEYRRQHHKNWVKNNQEKLKEYQRKYYLKKKALEGK